MAVEGISVPDTGLVREVTELGRDTEADLLYSTRALDAFEAPAEGA